MFRTTRQRETSHVPHGSREPDEGKGFFKLNEDSIPAIREVLAADYKALENHHSDEVVQILEEYGVVDLEIALQLYQYKADKQATGLQPVKTVELPNSPTEEAASNPIKCQN